MIDDILSGTWKGELITPRNYTNEDKDRTTKFLIRITYHIPNRAFKGIFISDPEETGISSHAKLAGDVSNGDRPTFEMRYSKMYIYERSEKQILSTDSVRSKMNFQGNLINGIRLLGDWSDEPTYFDYQGIVRKTIPRSGMWWATKLSKIET